MDILTRIFGCFRKSSYDSIGNGDTNTSDNIVIVDTIGSSNHNSENNNNTDSIVEESSSGTENVRNDNGCRFIDTTEWCDFPAMSPFSLDGNNNNDGSFNNKNNEDDGEDNIPDDSCNNSNSNASNDNNNGKNNSKDNNNNNGSNNYIYSSKPAINRARTPIPSGGHQSNPLRSPMTTRRKTSPKFCQHAQLTPDGRAAQEIWYNKKGKITIVGDLDHICFDNIENYNHNHNNNNEEGEEGEGEELLCPQKKLDFEPLD